MCKQLGIRSSVEGVLITLDYQYPLSFYLVCNFSTWYVIITTIFFFSTWYVILLKCILIYFDVKA